uniref:Cysteine-rich with EGF-like domains 1b n=1 Tax=Sinocyclocheilus grahami TaxID=75366 RepID=A0A672Q2S4_SINGR
MCWTAHCQTCRRLTDSFTKGLERTANKNFGGGNTAWEEEKLAKYARSETRLLEIVEAACDKPDFDCNRLLEQIEDQVETWWFHRCLEAVSVLMSVCVCVCVCVCAACPSGPGGVCGGLDRCEGEGTRLGNGDCVCDPGYSGVLCQDCAHGYYRETSSNHTQPPCSACHHSCKKCTGPQNNKCLDCKPGWILHSNKCVGEFKSTSTEIQTHLESGLNKSHICKNWVIYAHFDAASLRNCSTVCSPRKTCCVTSSVCVLTAGPEKALFEDMTDDEVLVLQQMFFGVVTCSLATLAAKGDMVFTAIFIGGVAAMAGYWLSEKGDRVLYGILKVR